MADTLAEASGTKEVQQPAGPEWRSKVEPKDPSQVAKYPEMPYEEGATATVTGPRGKKILVIYKKYPNGKYQMKDGDRILQKLYDEADLSPATSLV